MAKILLDYFFPITSISPTPAASTAFLKQACLVVSPKDGEVDTGVAVLCTSMSQVAALTDNEEAQALFDAGMSRVYILPMDDLDLEDAIAAYGSLFFTILISSDFDDADIVVAQAQGTATITSYANLIDTAPDTLTIGGVVMTAQAGAATPGDATFRAATSNDLTAASLASQINAHETLKDLVVATVLGAVVTIKAKDSGWGGNDIAVAYADGSPTTVGLTLAGLSGGKLAGGAGLFLGTFKGVTGISSDDDAFLALQAAMENRCGFHILSSNGAKPMLYAFGKLLSNALDWTNQQYIPMPLADDVDELGECNALFDDKVSFVLTDDEFANRLGLLACGGKAIVAPYILRNLQIDLQSKGLQYVSANQPAYTKTQAALLEDELQKVIDGDSDNPGYVGKGWITEGSVDVRLEQDNFVASGYIEVPTPRALWRIFGQMKQS